MYAYAEYARHGGNCNDVQFFAYIIDRISHNERYLQGMHSMMDRCYESGKEAPDLDAVWSMLERVQMWNRATGKGKGANKHNGQGHGQNSNGRRPGKGHALAAHGHGGVQAPFKSNSGTSRAPKQGKRKPTMQSLKGRKQADPRADKAHPSKKKGAKYCSYHKTDSHDDSECKAQGNAPPVPQRHPGHLPKATPVNAGLNGHDWSKVPLTVNKGKAMALSPYINLALVTGKTPPGSRG